MKEQCLILKDIPFAYTLRSIRDDYFLLFYIIANIIKEDEEIKNESFQEEGSIHLHAYQKLYYSIKFRNYQCLILRGKPSLFQKENITPLCYYYVNSKNVFMKIQIVETYIRIQKF
ncbi:hypothetical protein H312_02426 [Anncaliia algerae PRA339]|uniref:Uncharacterized protein n=1 Tax=Anncaliia algerae PRA339 TaxID=1288291 RepID=A0A059EZ40_9MICR|nr:hypothetical protein H312_02426 [Anncaliia algerae PRA339]